MQYFRCKSHTLPGFDKGGFYSVVTEKRNKYNVVDSLGTVWYFTKEQFEANFEYGNSSTTQPSEDRVNHPSHYCSHPSGIECIQVTRHYCFSIGNAIKYLWRAGLKKEVSLEDVEKEIEDLNKAIWYINDRIKQLKEDASKH